MLMCTTRLTPARFAASNKTFELASACTKVKCGGLSTLTKWFLFTAGPAYIVDIELFSETLRQFLSGEPREDVGRAARRKWHNHAHSSFGIGLRPCNTRHRQRGSARGQMQKL